MEGFLFVEAVAITGNARALLRLRRQIGRALRDESAYPFEEAVYDDVHGEPFEVAVKRARSPEEMEEPGPKPQKTAERLPWAELAREAGGRGAALGRCAQFPAYETAAVSTPEAEREEAAAPARRPPVPETVWAVVPIGVPAFRFLI